MDEWYYDKNKEIHPDQIVSGTHKKVWWKCRTCGHDWEASIANRSKGRGCPKCARKQLSVSKEKEIFQYDLYGNYITKYPSREAAIKETGIKVRVASKDKTVSGGYIWLYEYDLVKAAELSQSKAVQNYILKNTSVLQYSLDGEFIRKYKSSGEAERINGIAPSKVGACCRGKRKSAGGYIWIFDNEE